MTTHAEGPSDARLIVRVLLQVGETTYPVGDAELGYEVSAIRALLTPSLLPATVSSLSPALRERIATLCTRLGEAEPAYSQLDRTQAT